MPALKITDADAGALSFAHLAGLATPRSEKGDGDKDYSKKSKKASDEDDEDDNDEQDRSDGDSKKSKKAKRADDGDDDDKKPDAEGDDDSPDDEEKKSSKKAKRADDGDDEEDDEPEMRGNSPVARARRREQARCAAIFNCSAAAKNIALAANLAFKTRLPRSEAVAILRDTPAAPSPSDAHSGRASRNPNIGSATGNAASDPSDRMVARMRAARGLK